ncbi:MAG: hypothetical protein IPN90_07680 [Elusimicrobia bacterium]|nr:hypothetical protein [Elusimicrobiota bacterium]
MGNKLGRIQCGWVLGVFFLLGSTAWGKLSLAVRFPEIEMENVQPGSDINIRQIRGVPYVLINGSDYPIEVSVVPEIPVPGPAGAKLDFEPIPNPEWLKIIPNRFKLGAGDLASAEVILSVPNDPKLIGRHFQVNIHAGSEGPEEIAVAINSFIRFTVGAMGPSSAKKEKKRMVLGALDLALTPTVNRLENVPLGKPVTLKGMKNILLKVTNRGNDPVKLKLTSVRTDNTQKETGWDVPDPAWLNITSPRMKIKPDQIKGTDLTLTIPDIPENKGKKFLFLIQAEMDGYDFPLSIFSRVFVTTE